MKRAQQPVEETSIVDAVKSLLESKGIAREDFQDVVEDAFKSVLRRKYDLEAEFYVTFNMDEGDIEIYREWEVVEDGEVENEATQMELTKALESDPDLEAGDEWSDVLDYRTFGRRTIINLKQALMHKIREIEKNAVYEEYKDRIGEIIHADVHQVDRGRTVVLNIDRTEFRMPIPEQVRTEKYYRGSSLRVLIKDVRRENNRDPEVIVSRSDPNFIRRLFEVEVPEITEGIIQVRKIARVPGRRTKIAVESNDPRIDPVGSCVGMKGVRIQAIVRELENEKIDIINYSTDAEAFIKKAMSPNKPLQVRLLGDGKALVVLNDDEHGKMIERQMRRYEAHSDQGSEFRFDPMGDMVFRLAAEISGYELSLAKESDHLASQLHEEEIEEDLRVTDVVGVGDEVAGQLIDNGIYLADSLLDETLESLLEKTGLEEKVIRHCRQCVAAYYQDFKLMDVVDLPRAYKEALVSAGLTQVDEVLSGDTDEICAQAGLDATDLADILTVLGDFSSPELDA
jgi:transcription termination/antitermination protein NusA